MRLLARTTWVFPAARFWIYALLMSGGAAATFTVTVTTSGASLVVPSTRPPPYGPFPPWRLAASTATLLALVFLLSQFGVEMRRKRDAWAMIAAVCVVVGRYRHRGLWRRWREQLRRTPASDCGYTFGHLLDYRDADGDFVGNFEAVSCPFR
jgi:hypothetical protein